MLNFDTINFIKTIATQGADKTLLQTVRDMGILSYKMLKEGLHEKIISSPGLRQFVRR